MLDRIVTMDETLVSYHTPLTKKQSKQWILKGQPGPIKAKVQASRTKQMVLAFFDSKGLIYSNIVPRGVTVNAAYIVKALASFMKNLKQKRPYMAAGDWWFHWDNAPVHTAASVKNWLAARGVQMLEHPPTRLTWPQPTSSCSPSSRRSWPAATCPRTTSRPSGRGSAGLLPPRTSPPPSGGGTSAARSVWTSEEAMLRNRKNKFRPISNTCVFIELVAFDFDCTTYLDCKCVLTGNNYCISRCFLTASKRH